MPYLVSSIIAVVSATILLLTRYEADDSAIMSQIEKMKTMVSMVDGFVNTYINSGGIILVKENNIWKSEESLNFQTLEDAGILLNGSILNPADSTGGFSTTMRLPNDNVIWQIIPNKDDSSSYKLLVDMSGDSTLMSKAVFSESFVGREYCEKMLFATLSRTQNQFDGTDDFESNGGTDRDGIFVCTVFK